MNNKLIEFFLVSFILIILFFIGKYINKLKKKSKRSISITKQQFNAKIKESILLYESMVKKYPLTLLHSELVFKKSDKNNLKLSDIYVNIIGKYNVKIITCSNNATLSFKQFEQKFIQALTSMELIYSYWIDKKLNKFNIQMKLNDDNNYFDIQFESDKQLIYVGQTIDEEELIVTLIKGSTFDKSKIVIRIN